VGRHSKNKPAAQPSSTGSSSGPTVSGAQFDALFNASRINAGPAQTAEQRIEALKKSNSDAKRKD
jgi:hypothetical protein